MLTKIQREKRRLESNWTEPAAGMNHRDLRLEHLDSRSNQNTKVSKNKTKEFAAAVEE
jgi:hypothetical protein